MPVQTSWIERANCLGADPELFFPDRGANQTNVVQRMFCGPCEVKAECLDYALDYESSNGGYHHYGIYGGVGPARRKALKKTYGKRPARTP